MASLKVEEPENVYNDPPTWADLYSQRTACGPMEVAETIEIESKCVMNIKKSISSQSSALYIQVEDSQQLQDGHGTVSKDNICCDDRATIVDDQLFHDGTTTVAKDLLFQNAKIVKESKSMINGTLADLELSSFSFDSTDMYRDHPLKTPEFRAKVIDAVLKNVDSNKIRIKWENVVKTLLEVYPSYQFYELKDIALRIWANVKKVADKRYRNGQPLNETDKRIYAVFIAPMRILPRKRFLRSQSCVPAGLEKSKKERHVRNDLEDIDPTLHDSTENLNSNVCNDFCARANSRSSVSTGPLTTPPKALRKQKSSLEAKSKRRILPIREATKRGRGRPRGSVNKNSDEHEVLKVPKKRSGETLEISRKTKNQKPPLLDIEWTLQEKQYIVCELFVEFKTLHKFWPLKKVMSLVNDALRNRYGFSNCGSYIEETYRQCLKLAKDNLSKHKPVRQLYQKMLLGLILPGDKNEMKEKILRKLKGTPYYKRQRSSSEPPNSQPHPLKLKRKTRSNVTTEIINVDDDEREYVVDNVDRVENQGVIEHVEHQNVVDIDDHIERQKMVENMVYDENEVVIDDNDYVRHPDVVDISEPGPATSSVYGLTSTVVKAKDMNCEQKADDKQRTKANACDTLLKIVKFCNEHQQSFRYEGEDVVFTHDVTKKIIRFPASKLQSLI
ncbi:unnamed protein product [Bursaphelenchus okinawaensis]|uniref:Uncharacterized protein n=1 Tax=Bursaphelenchus okinawaensis TaxID=465554 RepID=A0A811KTH2_9BILA|nr:unnamed protein product [Bursaphelenchus okinawaensis]CAG9111143.1 unnamed protein product [Bursaphelenchus okinawaensis]